MDVLLYCFSDYCNLFTPQKIGCLLSRKRVLPLMFPPHVREQGARQDGLMQLFSPTPYGGEQDISDPDTFSESCRSNIYL